MSPPDCVVSLSLSRIHFVCGTNTDLYWKGSRARHAQFALCSDLSIENLHSRIRRHIIVLSCLTFSVSFYNFTFVELGVVFVGDFFAPGLNYIMYLRYEWLTFL